MDIHLLLIFSIWLTCSLAYLRLEPLWTASSHQTPPKRNNSSLNNLHREPPNTTTTDYTYLSTSSSTQTHYKALQQLSDLFATEVHPYSQVLRTGLGKRDSGPRATTKVWDDSFRSQPYTVIVDQNRIITNDTEARASKTSEFPSEKVIDGSLMTKKALYTDKVNL